MTHVPFQEELESKIERKLEILREEKEKLDDEVEENKSLGKEVSIERVY